MSDLVKRTYRVHRDHDEKVKRLADNKLENGKKRTESFIVRKALDKLNEKNA